MTRHQFKKLAFWLLIYTVLVILWGAWVRISHSGDGCGDTWPLCHGQLIPKAERGKTWVEFGHRLMSGFYGLIVVYFFFMARKLFPKAHYARKMALATLIFTITEALLGAKLVLFGLVTDNDTPYRVLVMGLHQLNSFMLTGAVALTYSAASLEHGLKPAQPLGKAVRLFPWIIIVIGITGAWAALANSLFPSNSLWQGLQEDLSADSHFLVRLRMFHPLLATLGAGFLAIYFWLQAQMSENVARQKSSLRLSLLLCVGILFGYGTLLLHAPVWMKILHLTLAHAIWVVLLQWIFFVRQEGQVVNSLDSVSR